MNTFRNNRIGFVFPALIVTLTLFFTIFSYANFMQSDIHHKDHTSTKDEHSTEIPIKTIADRQKYLKPVLKGGVKEFHLTAEVIRWEYTKGKTILVWGFNGQIPGPEIRVRENDKVRIVITNKLPKAITVHWHGVDVPFEQDGVPEITQKAIQPGEVYIYEFVAKPAGTRFYHAHGSKMGDEAEQLDMGLSGAFIIEPRNYKRPDREYVLILDDWQAMSEGHVNGHSGNYDLFTINGLAFPSTEPIKVRKGERVRLRIINTSVSTFHPMHLHGHQFKVVAVDGNPVPPAAQLIRNTITLHPGETYDIEFIANNPGTWLFHCHELHHADAGMATLIVYY